MILGVFASAERPYGQACLPMIANDPNRGNAWMKFMTSSAHPRTSIAFWFAWGLPIFYSSLVSK